MNQDCPQQQQDSFWELAAPRRVQSRPWALLQNQNLHLAEWVSGIVGDVLFNVLLEIEAKDRITNGFIWVRGADARESKVVWEPFFGDPLESPILVGSLVSGLPLGGRPEDGDGVIRLGSAGVPVN